MFIKLLMLLNTFVILPEMQKPEPELNFTVPDSIPNIHEQNPKQKRNANIKPS
jgi:hypothetical protein